MGLILYLLTMKDRRKLVELEICEFIDILRKTTVSTDGAINHLGVSRNKFYQLKKDKSFPKPQKLKGFKELVYELGDLNKYLEDLKRAGEDHRVK